MRRPASALKLDYTQADGILPVAAAVALVSSKPQPNRPQAHSLLHVPPLLESDLAWLLGQSVGALHHVVTKRNHWHTVASRMHHP
jgi:hypothetical protein